MELGCRMRLLLLHMMTLSGILNETLDNCMMRASKNIDDQTDRNNEMDLISTSSLINLSVGVLEKEKRTMCLPIIFRPWCQQRFPTFSLTPT